jgi:hypothetical protein
MPTEVTKGERLPRGHQAGARIVDNHSDDMQLEPLQPTNDERPQTLKITRALAESFERRGARSGPTSLESVPKRCHTVELDGNARMCVG